MQKVSLINSSEYRLKKALEYDRAIPRYTSYPTVPAWDTEGFSPKTWLSALSDEKKVKLYVHLPYCEQLCTYCGCNKRITVNHAVEAPYIDVVLKEWELWKAKLPADLAIEEIHLGGGTPTFFSTTMLSKLIKGLTKGVKVIHPNYSVELHPAVTSLEQVHTLYDLGFRRFSIGVQCSDNKVLKAINRFQTLTQISRITTEIRSLAGTSINWDLVYGLPNQTFASIADTLEWVAQFKPDRIAWYGYAHVPWKSKAQRGFSDADLPSPTTRFQMQELGAQKLEAMGYQAIGIDHFALPTDELAIAYNTGVLNRNFMGYTHSQPGTIVGLGCSSISESWAGFAQNEPNVEAYIEHINNGNFALVKGHLHTEADRKIGKHITSLMCMGKTSFTISEEHEEWFWPFRQRTNFLENDGLVRWENGPATLVIPKRGNIFARLVAFQLDLRYWENAQQTRQQFSKAV